MERQQARPDVVAITGLIKPMSALESCILAALDWTYGYFELRNLVSTTVSVEPDQKPNESTNRSHEHEFRRAC
jgi:hypothetical protein